MADLILGIVISLLLSRAIWKFMGGLREGLAGPRARNVPDRGVHMERDPVCGTFVAPSVAVVLHDGGRRLYFCSTACRDKFRARTA